VCVCVCVCVCVWCAGQYLCICRYNNKQINQ